MARLVTWTEDKKSQAFEDIIEHITKGNSLRSIIDNSDRSVIPSMPTFMEWLDQDEVLANHYARALRIREDLIFDEILSIADKQGEDIIETDNGFVTNHNVIQRNKLQVDARKWYLAKMNPKRYGEKSINENINYNSENLTPERISEIKKQIDEKY